MLRELLTLVVPLLLPTVLYLLWLQMMRRSQASGALPWLALPWVWLAVSGVVLTAVVLLVVTVHYGTSMPGIYVPPHVEHGEIVQGHVEPKP